MKLSSAEYQRQWRKKNPDYHKQRNKQWRKDNPDYHKQRNKQWRKDNPDYGKQYYAKVENRAKALIANAKFRSAKKGGEVSITFEWVMEKISQGFCEISKLPFDLSVQDSTKNNMYAPSLDRIDSKNPNYSEDNTKVVIWAVNRLHGDDSLMDILPILKAVLDNLVFLIG